MLSVMQPDPTRRRVLSVAGSIIALGATSQTVSASSDEATHPTMGTAGDVPTAVLFGNLKCPFTSQVVTSGTLDAIVSEFVEPGAMNLQYRELAYRPGRPGTHYINDNGELKAQLAQGVWEEDPDSYWDFLEHAFANLDGWTPLSGLEDLARDAGVANVGTIVDGVENDRYIDPLEETAAVAANVGVSFVPTLEIRGETMSPRHSRRATLDWIDARL